MAESDRGQVESVGKGRASAGNKGWSIKEIDLHSVTSNFLSPLRKVEAQIGLTSRELRVRSTRLDEVGGPSKAASGIFVVQPSYRPFRSTRRRRSPIEQRRWRAAGSATQPNNCVVMRTLQLQSQAVAASSPSPTKRCLAMCSLLEYASVNQEFNITLCCSTPYKEGANAPGSAAGAVEFTIYGSLGTWCTSLLPDMSKHESCIWELFRCPCAGFMWAGGSDGRASLSSPRLVASGGGGRPELSGQPLLSSIIRRTASGCVIISNLDVMAAFKVPRTATEAPVAGTTLTAHSLAALPNAARLAL
ncbi:hypothetical protein MUK42_35150 [Musa troglodytarum]|uniref:Uncharacterized protein n=1 Tax=Musa troglodytarum TaxID=320322 RepID=A0A9E7E9X8_9LILI|nr:hypothetical protein MUK42_35150 [Musa troglodytarum]